MAISDLIIGALMVVFGLIGLILAAGAMDNGIYIFGLSLFAYACIFTIGLLRRHYDTQDAAGKSHHG